MYGPVIAAGELFVPAIFVLFNAGDLAGRAAACYGPWAAAPPPSSTLLAYAAARAVPAAGLLLCNVLVPGTWRLPTLLGCCQFACPSKTGIPQYQ